jgi:hypothetical protein
MVEQDNYIFLLLRLLYLKENGHSLRNSTSNSNGSGQNKRIQQIQTTQI